MEVIREFLDKNFKTIVTEIEGNYQVTFQGVGGQEGYVTFRRAKVGWNRKPISQNTYLVGDADMYQIVDTLKLYMGLNESHITEVKNEFQKISIEKLEEYLTTPTSEEEVEEKDTDEETDNLTTTWYGREDTFQNWTSKTKDESDNDECDNDVHEICFLQI